MFTAILIAVALIAAFPMGLKLAKWIDGDAGLIITRSRELMGQGYSRDQAEEMAANELLNR
jgi:hypothetical protein